MNPRHTLPPIARLLLAGALLFFAAPVEARSPLTPEALIEARRRIERVYYEHRIWPNDNPGPKPPFEEMVPETVIERRALDPLRKTAALKRFWNLDITPAMLQQETERMARDTNDSATLRELFAALGDDPSLIAETLARDQVSDRLLRKAFASDRALHAAARRRAETILALGPGADWEGISVRENLPRAVMRHRPAGNGNGLEAADPAEPAKVPARADEFAALGRRFPRAGGAPRWTETDTGFLLERRREATGEGITIESLFISKRSFDDWWSGASWAFAVSPPLIPGASTMYRLPAIPTAPGCDQWTPTSLVNAPSARTQHAAVWTGSEMIITVGQGATGDVTGGRYYPATDSWLPTSTGAGVPSQRQNHTAVWTGREMIVWGGYNGFFGLNDGSRYNPVSDSWIWITTAGAPSARYNHTAVWTGTEMIVWGGNVNATGFATGGRYNPGSDTWKPTSTGANVPAERCLHTAAWTGARMIVWGGQNSSVTFLNNGALYDPVTDSWTPMTQAGNVPVGRFSHTAIWTGNEMIVWGGADDRLYPGNPCCYASTNTGSAYATARDQWRATTLINAPAARHLHTAVWTGIEMIVWGGAVTSPSGDYNSGGRYYPDSDVWLPTSTGANVPSSRYWFTGVWTGNALIVWGGGTNTGGVYISGSAPSPGNSLRGTKSSSVNLTWSWVNGAGSYNVKRCEPAAAPCVPATIVSTPTINQYSEPNDALSHFYAVEAVNGCGATP